MRGSPGPRIFKRTVIPAGARAVVGKTDFRSLPQPFRGSPFFAGRRARRAGIQALASFRKRGEAECSGSELLESRRSFPGHRRFCPVKMPQLAVRRFSPLSAAAPPGLERKPGFRLSARALKCDAAGFQRTLALARNSRPTRETRAPAGMTGHGNAGAGPAKQEQISEEISYQKPDDFHHPSYCLSSLTGLSG